MKRYLSSEDSMFLRESLAPYSGETCLEIGFGSGSNLALLSEKFDFVVGTDIFDIQEARNRARSSGEVVLADRATCFRDSTFELVVFNPPYLPSDSIVDFAVDGGAGGIQIPMMFLDDALRVLKPSGRILMLLSSEDDLEAFQRCCVDRGLTVRATKEKRIFYERLVVYEIEEPTKEG